MELSPWKKSVEALELDNTDLTEEQQFQWAKKKISWKIIRKFLHISESSYTLAVRWVNHLSSYLLLIRKAFPDPNQRKN